MWYLTGLNVLAALGCAAEAGALPRRIGVGTFG